MSSVQKENWCEKVHKYYVTFDKVGKRDATANTWEEIANSM